MTEELVGRYRIVRRLGAGGLGTVDLAHDTLLDRPVALKRITAGEASADRRKRLLREGQLAARLDHPNIARILDCVALDEELVLVLEYVEGETLGARLRRDKRLPVGVTKHIAGAVLDALGHAHRASVVHRDVKPENVMLVAGADADRPGVKLLDFGIGKRLDGAEPEQLTATGAAVGTLAFMSPEQAMGLPVDARTDLYGAGATMFAMLSGRPAVSVRSLSELLRSLCEGDPPSLADVPGVDAQLDALVQRALARAPAERFATAEEMQAALVRIEPARATDEAAVIATVTSHEPATLVEEKAPPPPPATRWPKLLAITAIAAAGAGAVVWWSGPGTKSPPPVATAVPVATARADAEVEASVVGVDAAPAPALVPTTVTARDAEAPREASAGAAPLRVRIDTKGVTTEPAGIRALEGALAGCVRRPAFDAAANGFGRLVVRIAAAGTVEDARYLGFDEVAAPAFEPARARRSRVQFDDLGQCLRDATVGRRVAPSAADADRELIVTFAP